MTEFIRVASVKDVSERRMIGVKIDRKDIMIANLGGRFYAMGNRCTHQGCLLSKGTLEEEKVSCPCHFSVFDVKTGKVIRPPALKPQPTYEVKVQGNDILIKSD
ncbi:MAG: non-heme iron oxygenase ferredoxin subunit [archaeon]|nr:non-heme iron oxygenase ferredoxin subunit [archaeon]